jgi:uncharacterized protein YjbI with pentapeptide repeats
MPEQPAKNFFGFSWGSESKQPERLATPEELAEYGALAPDPETEAKILALFEEQLLQDLIRESPTTTVVAGTPATAIAPKTETELEANKRAEARKLGFEPLASPGKDLLDEIDAKTPAEPAPTIYEVVPDGLTETLSTAAEMPQKPSEADIAAAQALLAGEVEEVVAEKPRAIPPETDVAAAKALLAGEIEEAVEEKPTASPSEKDIAAAKALLAGDVEEEAELVVDDEEETRGYTGGLVEFAEKLDQHRLWAESAGEQGTQGHFSGADLSGVDLTAANLQSAELQKANLRGADLSMANLRHANLVEADLRETNLLGTEFSGANLMGANLYGAQGLWAGRLGGTNLFDATLPEAVAALNGRKTIEEFTQAARWFYLVLMTVCVCACGLIALTTDVRLLLDESATVTARIPRVLPLQGFYLGAPLLLTVLYMRLQFLLLRLWGSMGALPAVFPDGQTPEKDGRWYLMGPIRPFLRWTREPHSAVGMVECYLAMGLAYWAVPVVLFLFWLRYLVMQDYRGTLLQVFLFTVASAGACGMPRVVKRVLRPGDWTDESTPQFLRDVLRATRVAVLAGLTLFLLSLGVIRGLPGDMSVRPDVGRGDPRRWVSTVFQSVGYRPYADLTEESISTRKEIVQGNEANGPRLNEINLRYSRGYHAQFAGARMWRADLEGSSLADSDFRGANLREANLRSAKMDHVLAEKANFVSADARGAAFNAGDITGSDWSFANLQGATLTTADLSGATLYSVNLRQANLLRAKLAHTDLRDAHLEEAVLSLAELEQTDLSAAKLMGANLTGVQAKGTIFLEADLSKADLRGGMFAGAVLRQVKLDGANVMGADFRGALGLEAWQVCATQGWRGAQFDADVQAAVMASCGSAQ